MLIDSHFHLPHEKYRKDGKSVEDVVNEASAEGVEKLITIGTSLKENEHVLAVAKKHENVYATIGIYPHEEMKKPLGEIYESFHMQYLENKDEIIGIGECGIDITEWKGGRSLEDQLELFKMQVGFAADFDLPLVIHNRNGDEHVARVLKTYENKSINLRGVLHCFASNWESAQKFLALGFYLSFSGMITYPSVSPDLLEVIEKVPDDRILVETDSPYLPPQGHRGEVNYPKYVKIVAEKVASIKKKSLEDVSMMTYQNACRLFNI